MIEGSVIARRPCRYSGLSVTRPLTIKLLFDELSGRYLQIPAPFFYGGSSAFPPDRQGGLKPGRGNVVDRRFVTFLCAVRAVPKFYDIFSMAFRCLSGFLSGGAAFFPIHPSCFVPSGLPNRIFRHLTIDLCCSVQ